MKAMLLSRFEAIQADEDPIGTEERDLAHLVRVEGRVLQRAYGFGCVHVVCSSRRLGSGTTANGA
jgi:hypothetical protein